MMHDVQPGPTDLLQAIMRPNIIMTKSWLFPNSSVQLTKVKI